MPTPTRSLNELAIMNRPLPRLPEIFLWIAGAAGTVPASASAVRHLFCPAEVKVLSIRLVDLPEPWTADIPAPLRLHAAAPMAGPPATKAYLSPYSSTKQKKGGIERFLFGPPDADGNWLSCKYGADNAVILAKRLKDDITECSVSYIDEGNADTKVTIECK